MIMDIKVISKDEWKIELLITDTEAAYMNAFRRLILEETATIAIEDVEFKKNSSALYDEIVAHRLGLVPLTSDSSYVMPSECTCNGEGCAKCTVKLSLSAKGPGVITASKLKSSDPKVVPVFEKMPIVKLLANQQVQLDANGVMGKGKEHAKWSPGHVYYQQVPKVVLNEKQIKDAQEFAKNSPVNVFEVKSGKISVDEEKVLKNHTKIDSLEDYSPAVTVSRSSTDFIFVIESFGQLSPKQIMLSALDMFDNKLETFVTALKSLGM